MKTVVIKAFPEEELRNEINKCNEKLFIENEVLMTDDYAKNGVKYNGTFKMIATKIYESREGVWIMSFDCPFCFNKYKKDGKPYKNAKLRHHVHGFCEEERERGYIKDRVSACDKMKDYIVYMSDSTEINSDSIIKTEIKIVR